MARDELGGGYYVDLLLNSYCWIEVRDNDGRTDGGGYHYNQYYHIFKFTYLIIPEFVIFASKSLPKGDNDE